MNKVILGGRLTKDVELRKANNGSSYANVILHCKNCDGSNTFVYMECIFWNDNANKLANRASKGTYVLLEGKINKSSYESNGNKVYNTNVSVEKFEILDNVVEENVKEEKEEKSYTPRQEDNNVFDYNSDDLPF